MLNINLKGVFLGCKYALPELMKQGGAVLSTASISGLEGTNGLPHYCASKAGIIALTKVIAMDYAQYGVRANCICPGGVNTALNETYRPNDPEGLKHCWAATSNAHLLGRQGEPKRLRAPRCSSARTTPRSSPGRRLPWTADSPSAIGC